MCRAERAELPHRAPTIPTTRFRVVSMTRDTAYILSIHQPRGCRVITANVHWPVPLGTKDLIELDAKMRTSPGQSCVI